MPLTVNFDILKENKFDYPFRIFVSGSSQSGKTYFTRELLDNIEIFKKPINRIRYCHPDYLSELPVNWHQTLNLPVSYQSGLPSLSEICDLEPDTCIVLDDLYEEAIQSKAIDYLFRVLSGKKNISVVIMSQRYFATGRFGMNIRNNCNFTVMMRNADDRVNSRIARTIGLADAYKKAAEEIRPDNYYPYIFVDSSPRGQVSSYKCYTDIFSKAQTVFSQRGMKAYIISEHDFLVNFNLINFNTAERKNGVDATNTVRSSDRETESEERETVKTDYPERVQKRLQSLKNKRRRIRSRKNLY